MRMTCLTTNLLRAHSLISSRRGTMIDRSYQDESGIENAHDPSTVAVFFQTPSGGNRSQTLNTGL